MRIATKLSAGAALHIVVLAALLAYHVRTIRNAVSTGQELSEISLRIHVTSTQQRVRLSRLGESAAKYAVTRDPGYLERFQELRASYGGALEQLRSLPLTGSEQRELDSLVAQWAELDTLADHFIEAMHVPARAAPHDSLARLQLLIAALRLQTQHMSEASQSVMVARLERSALAARKAERLSWLGTGGALLLSVVVSALIVRSIVGPLRRLAHGTREVARGRFDYRLDSSGADELAQVAGDFDTMTARLGELDRMKRDFTSRISHDLKTPIASMRETTDILLDELPGPLTDTQRRLLLLNQQSGVHLSSMVAKLLDLSRLESGVGQELRWLEPAQLVRHAASQSAAACADKAIGITVETSEPRILARCDADGMLQLLHNLIENAIKFSPPGGKIRIELRTLCEREEHIPPESWALLADRHPSSEVLLITVADNGPGVGDEHKARLFERFYQTEAGRAVPNRGVGLGLTICREIVSAHGGAIWAADNPAGGTIFHILIPGAITEAAGEQLSITAAASEAG